MQNSLESVDEVENLFDRLFPIMRSIMGNGYRESLNILKEYIPFNENFYFSGTDVLNWRVPLEWNISEAYIENSKGQRIIDIKDSTLHVVNYSAPVDGYFSLTELKNHIYTIPTIKNAIPYTISYYKKRWGFCMTQDQLDSLPEDSYHAVIKSSFEPGKLVVGECVLKGQSKKEILLSTYLCHPSMANNELSGPIVLAMLYNRIKNWKNRKYTYRFVITPETIGAISYLSDHGEELKKNLHAGFVLTCLGGNVPLRIKLSRRGNSPFDIISKEISSGSFDSVINNLPTNLRINSFDASSGSDERQYCSPGFNLPVSQVARLVYAEYKEYHNSLDTKELMGIENLFSSCNQIEAILKLEEEQKYYINLHPFGEVKLGDYDLYPSLNTNGYKDCDKSNSLKRQINSINNFVGKVMNYLNLADGTVSLHSISKMLGCDSTEIEKITAILVEKDLISEDL